MLVSVPRRIVFMAGGIAYCAHFVTHKAQYVHTLNYLTSKVTNVSKNAEKMSTQFPLKILRDRTNAVILPR